LAFPVSNGHWNCQGVGNSSVEKRKFQCFSDRHYSENIK
jgi:hypothetical protein